jgi:aspartyl-tRNA(Asn)/glutamyl-tRNA(Gln) amidotransferase subunit A
MNQNAGNISKIHDMLVNRKVSCVEITQKYLKEIEKSELNAYIRVTEHEALTSAALVDSKLEKGEDIGLLEGIPMTLKDVISTRGIPTTCASKMLENYVPIYDASCWDILKKQGVVLLGKSNQDEFAMGSSNESSYFGPVKNPHDLTKVPGGSSGGGAAAVAGGLAAFAIGSDTGGSVRQPAAFCGVVGLKPSYGAVSRYGLIALASSFDQIGPITLTVRDASIVYDSISRYDRKDSSCSPHKRVKTLDMLENEIKGLKIGIPQECFKGISDEVGDAIERAIGSFEKLGARIEKISLPSLDYAISVYYVLQCAEASSNFGRYDGIRFGYRPESYENIEDLMVKSRTFGFGEEVKRRILLGTYVLSSRYYDSYYLKASELREFITREFNEAFDSQDVLLIPTTPTTAFGFNHASNPVEMYLSDVCTVPVNEARLPAISVPCGYDSNGLPIGVQLLGARFREGILLNAAYKYECENFYAKTVGGVEI